MNIIEKLGISPIKRKYYFFSTNRHFDIDEVRKLEQQRNEMLEALIERSLSEDKKYGIRNWSLVEAIEKATGKTWQQIKELAI